IVLDHDRGSGLVAGHSGGADQGAAAGGISFTAIEEHAAGAAGGNGGSQRGLAALKLLVGLNCVGYFSLSRRPHGVDGGVGGLCQGIFAGFAGLVDHIISSGGVGSRPALEDVAVTGGLDRGNLAVIGSSSHIVVGNLLGGAAHAAVIIVGDGNGLALDAN